ncbi:MAG: VWA domain-containing protein [bacterium]
MKFANPEFFYLLFIIPLLILNYIKRRKGANIKFSDLQVLKEIPTSKSLKYKHCAFILRLLYLILIIISVARPQLCRTEGEILTEGVDIILALDISGSMQAEDFKPQNRIKSAKQVIREFVKGRKNDRLGLVVFASQSFTQCPLTLDYGTLLSLLNQVNIGMIEDGTAIGMALVNCVNRLKDSQAKSKIVILLTDGVNNCGKIDPITSARIAQAMNVRIYTIGVGKKGGAPIPVNHPIFGKIYARNPDGSLLLTKVDEDTLKTIANITDGKFFRATNEHKLSQIYEDIGKMEKTKIKVKEYMKYKEIFGYFLLPAILLLLAEIILANTRFRRIP